MATTIHHRGVRIVTLDEHESIEEHCRENDIAIVRDASGWWTCFVGENGSVEKYDIAFDTWEKAMHTAKAAAEYSTE
jgi:hypothetical protein